MARAEWMRAFLLLGFISAVHLSPKLRFEMEGPYSSIDFDGDDDNVLYRIYEDGDLLLVNCSQPDRPQPDGYNITCLEESYHRFKFGNLMVSHSGLYKAESWRAGNVTKNETYDLIACADTSGVVEIPVRIHSSEIAIRRFNRGEVVCKLNENLGNGTSLRVYRLIEKSYVLVLDTSSSLEPLVEDLKGRLQLDFNSSQVTLHGDAVNFGNWHCTIWRDGQCQSISSWMANYIEIFAHEEENLTLPCFLNYTQMDTMFPYWVTPNGAVRLNLNQTWGQEGMYMLNGRQSGDYSLIIPTVSQQHSDVYACRSRSGFTIQIFLYVCPESLPTDVMFSHRESVSIPLSFNDTPRDTSRVHWYRKKALQSEELIVDCGDSDDFVDELRGRVSVNRYCYSLNISNLREEDSAVYTWRVFQPTEKPIQNLCYVGSIRLVYRDPFGVDSQFYRAYGSVLGAVLLGLVAAVIWVNLRSRRGQQIPRHERRKRKQSGGEDPNDAEEEAEDSV